MKDDTLRTKVQDARGGQVAFIWLTTFSGRGDAC